MMEHSPSLRRHLERARAAWATLVWDEVAYVAWLRAERPDELEAALEPLEPGEVVLCWAAGRGDPEALRLFEAHFIAPIADVLRKFGESSAFLDEVAQRVRVKLLIPKDGAALSPVADYALGGRLGALVRVAATREAISLRRTQRPQDVSAPLDHLVGVADPALAALKRQYAVELDHSLRAALAELPARDRQLLRLNLSIKASIDEIATMFGTHRATAARWLAAARARLAENTRQHLSQRLRLAPEELTSLLRLVRTEATRMLDSLPGADDDAAR